MAKYKVISGIMEGLEFNGSPVKIDGESRIWNEDSTGQSFKAENCKNIILDICECEECGQVKECESVLWYPETSDKVFLYTCIDCQKDYRDYIKQ